MKTLTDNEAINQIIELLKESHLKYDKAPSETKIFKQINIGRKRFDRLISQLIMDCRIEEQIGTRYRYIRLTNSGADWPVSRTEIIIDAITEINRAGKPAKSADIASIVNCTGQEIKSTLNELRKFRRLIAVTDGPCKSPLYTAYVIDRPEFAGILAKYPLKGEGTGAKKKLAHPPIRPSKWIGSAITWREIANARAQTKPGDVVPVRYRKGPEPVIVVNGLLTVKYVLKNICVFESGDSVKWKDMVLFYRNGAPLEIEKG